MENSAIYEVLIRLHKSGDCHKVLFKTQKVEYYREDKHILIERFRKEFWGCDYDVLMISEVEVLDSLVDKNTY